MKRYHVQLKYFKGDHEALDNWYGLAVSPNAARCDAMNYGIREGNPDGDGIRVEFVQLDNRSAGSVANLLAG